MGASREGGLDAPVRHRIDWRSDEFWDENALNQELERVFDICHGCRRCVSLCQAFPTLFDLVDESATMEVDGVDPADYPQVAEQCYLCDLCFQVKCPYVPPHEWALDFPHLMLRAKAQAFRKNGARLRDRMLTATDRMGRLGTIPLVDKTANGMLQSKSGRKLMRKTLAIDETAALPEFARPTFRQQVAAAAPDPIADPIARVALFTTCYGNHHDPRSTADLMAVLRHNQVHVEMVAGEVCCGMPKLELGDLDAVARLKARNIPQLAALAADGYRITAPIPSCVLMFRQELPLMFADDADVIAVQNAMVDPFELLTELHRAGQLKTDFKQALGTVVGQAACHQRVQNIGPRTRDILSLIPDLKLEWIERCSGHDGTYAIKAETADHARKIVRPVVRKAGQATPDHVTSDCPMAGRHIAHNMEGDVEALHPVSLLRKAYGI